MNGQIAKYNEVNSCKDLSDINLDKTNSAALENLFSAFLLVSVTGAICFNKFYVRVNELFESIRLTHIWSKSVQPLQRNCHFHAFCVFSNDIWRPYWNVQLLKMNQFNASVILIQSWSKANHYLNLSHFHVMLFLVMLSILIGLLHVYLNG